MSIMDLHAVTIEITLSDLSREAVRIFGQQVPPDQVIEHLVVERLREAGAPIGTPGWVTVSRDPATGSYKVRWQPELST